MNKQQILDIFIKTGALMNGHFKLTSGLHSNVYFQCALVLQYPVHSEYLGKLIISNFQKVKIDTVISPAVGGIVVGQEVGRLLGVRTIFSEREEGKMNLRRGFSIQGDERVLICEDVVTTGGSVFEVIELVRQKNAQPVGVGAIVDRSNGKVNFGIPQFSCIKLKVETFDPAKCPMCKKNIAIIKPGSRNI